MLLKLWIGRRLREYRTQAPQQGASSGELQHRPPSHSDIVPCMIAEAQASVEAVTADHAGSHTRSQGIQVIKTVDTHFITRAKRLSGGYAIRRKTALDVVEAKGEVRHYGRGERRAIPWWREHADRCRQVCISISSSAAARRGAGPCSHARPLRRASTLSPGVVTMVPAARHWRWGACTANRRCQRFCKGERVLRGRRTHTGGSRLNRRSRRHRRCTAAAPLWLVLLGRCRSSLALELILRRCYTGATRCGPGTSHGVGKRPRGAAR